MSNPRKFRIVYTNILGETFTKKDFCYYSHIKKEDNLPEIVKIKVNTIKSYCNMDFFNTEIFKTPSGAIYGLKALYEFRKKKYKKKYKRINKSAIY